MNVQITKHHVDKENKILEIEIECRTSRSHTEPKLRGSLVFDAGCGRRYFPVVAGKMVRKDSIFPRFRWIFRMFFLKSFRSLQNG